MKPVGVLIRPWPADDFCIVVFFLVKVTCDLTFGKTDSICTEEQLGECFKSHVLELRDIHIQKEHSIEICPKDFRCKSGQFIVIAKFFKCISETS